MVPGRNVGDGVPIASRVFGAITVVRPSRVLISFQDNAGVLFRRESGIENRFRLADHFHQGDEIEAWVLHGPDISGQYGLTLIEVHARWAAERNVELRHAIERGVALGSGVPFWQLYMQRRSKRTWN